MTSIDDDIKDFNAQTFVIMDTYRAPKDKKIYNNNIKALCMQYRHLLDSPDAGTKINAFISDTLNL